MMTKFVERWSRSLRLWQIWLAQLLVLPIAPLLAWGPFAHPLINLQALNRVRGKTKYDGLDVQQDLVAAAEEHEDVFVYAGNSADAISTHSVANGALIYDYMHNWIPDSAKGRPRFGQALVAEWYHDRGTWPDREGAVALGWLAHQWADAYPHYYSLDTECNETNAPLNYKNVFSGYCNAHPVLGADHYAPILARHRFMEHGLIEVLHDLMVREENPEGISDDSYCEMFNPVGDTTLVTEVSRKYSPERMLIPPEHVPVLRDDFNLVIDGMRLVFEIMMLLRPDLPAVLRDGPDGVRRREYFHEKSVDLVAREVFCRPVAPRARAAVTTALSDLDELTVGPTRTRPGSDALKFARQAEAWLSGSPIGRSFVFLERRLPRSVARSLLRCALRKIAPSPDSVSVVHSKEGMLPELRAFLAHLLLTRNARLEDAALAFQRLDRPAIAPAGQSSYLEFSEDYFRYFLKQGKVSVRLYPAGPKTDGPAKRAKGLAQGTLLFRVNGTPVSDLHEQGIVTLTQGFVNGDTDGVLQIDCEFDPAVLNATRGGAYHIFVDIEDDSGIRGKNIDLVIQLRALGGAAPG